MREPSEREKDILYSALGHEPLWMTVTGKPVRIEQAQEIIRRTDVFFARPSGDDATYLQRLLTVLRLPAIREVTYRDLAVRHGWGTTVTHDYVIGEDPIWLEELQRWQERWGYIPCRFIENDWISSETRMLWGCSGWCHPDGSIEYHRGLHRTPTGRRISTLFDPTGREMWEDWALLADAFPFLELGVTISHISAPGPVFSQLIGLLIRSGEVRVVDPSLVDVHAGHTPATCYDREYSLTTQPVPFSLIEHWVDQVYGSGEASSMTHVKR
jgi:hypothetical protein